MIYRFAFVVFMACSAADPPPAVQEREATVDSNPSGTIVITGTVTNEGVECPAVRTADNKLYTIAGGDRNQLKPGVRVRITGTVAEMSFCMQGTTLSATKIEVLP